MMEELYSMLLEESGCTKIVDEVYTSEVRKGRWFIRIETSYNCGLTEVKMIPDVRKNLGEDLEICVELEDYERAIKLRDILTDLTL